MEAIEDARRKPCQVTIRMSHEGQLPVIGLISYHVERDAQIAGSRGTARHKYVPGLGRVAYGSTIHGD